MIAITVGLAVFVGIALGLLGGGGSILTVPLLAYVAGLDAKQAIATSLLVVGVTSTVGAIAHARAGRVQWRTGLVFGVAAMAGAYSGGLLARFVPGTALMIAFAVMMIVVAVAMLRGRTKTAGAVDGHLRVGRILPIGVAVGMVSGLVGAGGGFLLVPALALLGGLPMLVAVGTSLAVISMQSFAGLAGHLMTEQIDWRLAGMVTGAAVVGSLIGGRLISLINPDVLRKIFGWFVLLMASVMLAEEIDPWVGVVAASLTLLAAGMSFVCARYDYCPLHRLAHRRGPDLTAA